MFTGVNINETKKVTLKCDPHPENPTIFTIGVSDAIVKAHIRDSATTAEGKFDSCGAGLLMIKFGLKAVENFGNVAFKTEKYYIGRREYEVVSDETLAVLGDDVVSELSILLVETMSLSGQESKN